MNKRTALWIVLATLLGCGSALADRGQNWEASVQLLGNSSETADGGSGESLDVDSAIGFAFGGAYNFNPYFAIGFDLSLLNPDYSAQLVRENGDIVSISHELDVINGQFNAIWNIIDGPFTPFVQAGLGWTYVDSNIASSPPVTGCWWDPWWGYICSDYYNTYDDTSFSYGGGAGLRFEFGDNLFLKGSYNLLYVDSGSTDLDFDVWRIELGWMSR